jgi:hypothetical protein
MSGGWTCLSSGLALAIVVQLADLDCLFLMWYGTVTGSLDQLGHSCWSGPWLLRSVDRRKNVPEQLCALLNRCVPSFSFCVNQKGRRLAKKLGAFCGQLLQQMHRGLPLQALTSSW